MDILNGDSEKRKAKGKKKVYNKKDLIVKNYEDCLFDDKIILTSQTSI